MTLNTVEKNAQTVWDIFSHTHIAAHKEALGFNISRSYRQYTRGFFSITGIYQLAINVELAGRIYSLLDAWTAPCVRVPVRTLYANRHPVVRAFNSPTICIEDILHCGFVLRKANLDLVHNT